MSRSLSGAATSRATISGRGQIRPPLPAIVTERQICNGQSLQALIVPCDQFESYNDCPVAASSLRGPKREIAPRMAEGGSGGGDRLINMPAVVSPVRQDS